MNFSADQNLFSFKLGGTDAFGLAHEKQTFVNGDQTITTYKFGFLKITNVFKKYGNYGAVEWVNYFENEGEKDTLVISELFDCDCALPLAREEKRGYTAYLPSGEQSTKIYAPNGSVWSAKEFYSNADELKDNAFSGYIGVGEKRDYCASGGRSSDRNAPFFRVHKQDGGYFFAVGWTGQWAARFERTEGEIKFRSGVQDAEFYIKPGEKFRTSSVVIMPYEGSETSGINKWRRLVKAHFSLIGQPGRDKNGPLCTGIWGGMRTSSVIKRIDCIEKNELPLDYIWMDAGWYGENTAPTPDEYEGDWPMHVGDWRVSPVIHPGGLKDVADKIHKAGKKFLLWFEPERVIKGTPVTIEHPDYCLKNTDPENFTLLFNLGNPEAWQYCFDTLSRAIGEIGVDCYRQDFNMCPLEYWRAADRQDRRGITEIKHINGLYKLWDALLEKFPHLLIDNCASGGRRIDIETLRRSIPLWRSDYQCPAYPVTTGTQCHNLTFSSWMPYSGTGCGRKVDEYSMRSAYAPAMTCNFFYSERDEKYDDPEKIAVIRRYLNEYLSVREFMSEDFYPLTAVSENNDTWCAYAFDRPEQGDGVIMVFRRENSPYECAKFNLGFLDGDYVFIDADGKTFDFSTAENGRNFNVLIFKKEKSKIYFYRKK